MIDFDDVTKRIIKEHNPNWPQILNHAYRVTIRGLGSGEMNSLFNITDHRPDIDQTYLHVKDPYKAKY